jgi:hypothetical protein
MESDMETSGQGNKRRNLVAKCVNCGHKEVIAPVAARDIATTGVANRSTSDRRHQRV